MKKETGGSAFPVNYVSDENGNVISYAEFGMTLRDYFAGQALALTKWTLKGENPSEKRQEYAQEIASAAYSIADAMIAERSK